MKNAILLHGRPGKKEYYDSKFPSSSNYHWFPWLQKQLLVRDIKADTPEIPLAYEPLWERWVKEVERFEIGPDTILVGHSCGAGFWVRYLSEHKDLKVGKVFLVAPWIDVEQEDPNHFFDFVVDKDLVKRTKGLTVFHSSNDHKEIQTSLKKLKTELGNFKLRIFNNYGHFTHKDMKTSEFPELLEEILS